MSPSACWDILTSTGNIPDIASGPKLLRQATLIGLYVLAARATGAWLQRMGATSLMNCRLLKFTAYCQ